jgi:hypothetical protein
MNFFRTLSTQIVKKNKINLDSHLYNFMLSQQSKDVIAFSKGNYKITDNVGEYYKNIKKYEMHESHSPKPFIKIKQEK